MKQQGASRNSPGLADPHQSRSNCGVGVVLDLDGDGSHSIVEQGLTVVENLTHRGATGAEENTGDGAGILLQIPDSFFRSVLDIELPPQGSYGVGTFFFPPVAAERTALKEAVERILDEQEIRVLTWREVPTDNSSLGQTALDSEPHIEQVFVAPKDGKEGQDTDFDRQLYIGRRAVENGVESEEVPGHDQFYIVSLDTKTIGYKGLLKGDQLREYFLDLQDERFRSCLAMCHARFSTNTLGAWHLAHPFRTLVHNGEFNTLKGNVNWMRARETELEHEAFGDDIETLKPIIDDPDQSDSASLDNTLELLLQSGRSLPHALRMLVPEAWRDGRNTIDDDRRAFYDYHASLIEPWDGPALVAATDGEQVGAILDRNGFRPCRYDVLTDNTLVLSSEVGALDVDESEIEERGRLHPGQCFLADPSEGRIVPDDEIFDDLSDDRYSEWVASEQVHLSALRSEAEKTRTADLEAVDTDSRRARQLVYGYTHDELEELIEPMATTGKDPVGSMGDDTPLSVLSDYNRPLFSYFKQLFAQVSNPPLDYIREELVTSLETRLGEQRNLLAETPAHARQLVLDSPILTDDEMAAIKSLETGELSAGEKLSVAEVDITYDPSTEDLESAVEHARSVAEQEAPDHDILVLTDRAMNENRVPIPSLLAVSGIHHHLVRNGYRNRVGIVLESGDPRTVHHIATLVGYGAGAVNPYLAYESIRDAVPESEGHTETDAIRSYIEALEDGLLKTMAKMGISTVESYRGAQIFEALGLSGELVDEYFEGTANRTDGISIESLESDLLDRHNIGYSSGTDLDRTGEYRNRSSGIHHQWNPETVRSLQRAVRNDDAEAYAEFVSKTTEKQGQLTTLRGLLEIDTDQRESVPLNEVESVEEIVTRFETAAMSLGSLSPEMHETNAIAMNRLGGKANTGEGGEQEIRYNTEKNCSVKQVASGRFGVTSTYLSSADEIQIKMAQGSKPGEGGHLPGKKVNEMIASVRFSIPGVGLISPPPQHDIYSIEDLKQLIHDLRAANPDADINVKLVAEDGIGVIAAGVAKANADVIHISGHSGGTGASPKTSIKNAGIPWELGLAEGHQLLCQTGMRENVRLTTDGGLQTGRDVAIAALLGAEGYVFGTSSLVTAGCVMARQCHENTCPVGIATQDENLRERFPGEPIHVIRYMRFIATELREIMADLGFRTIDEMIGEVELLGQRDDVDHEKAETVDLSGLLYKPESAETVDYSQTSSYSPTVPLDRTVLEELESAIETGKPTTVEASITNRDRATGAFISNRITNTHGTDGLSDDTLTVHLKGTAGQSFGAFAQRGLTLTLLGSANDYLGKGLSGGKLVVRTPDTAGYDAHESIVAGNVALYGATAGECYVNGAVGERFGVRNSGVKAVVEAVGDHACEYMTGGAVVVLGETGKNFAAGMSGGIAYVYDPDDELETRVNGDMVAVASELETKDAELLKRLVQNHAAYTGSERATSMLECWEKECAKFKRIMPTAYADIIAERESDDVRRKLPSLAVSDSTGVSGAVHGSAD